MQANHQDAGSHKLDIGGHVFVYTKAGIYRLVYSGFIIHRMGWKRKNKTCQHITRLTLKIQNLLWRVYQVNQPATRHQLLYYLFIFVYLLLIYRLPIISLLQYFRKVNKQNFKMQKKHHQKLYWSCSTFLTVFLPKFKFFKLIISVISITHLCLKIWKYITSYIAWCLLWKRKAIDLFWVSIKKL